MGLLSVVGGIAGGAIGTALGGPVGAAIGTSIGASVGSTAQGALSGPPPAATAASSAPPSASPVHVAPSVHVAEAFYAPVSTPQSLRPLARRPPAAQTRNDQQMCPCHQQLAPALQRVVLR